MKHLAGQGISSIDYEKEMIGKGNSNFPKGLFNWTLLLISLSNYFKPKLFYII